MKVVTYGNILNNSYNLTRFLRQKGVDAEMFLDDTSPAGQNYPWWEHTHLDPAHLPDWMHYRRVTVGDVIAKRPNFRAMAQEFARGDVSLVCSWGPIVAQAAGVPCVYYSHGSDLTAAHTAREAYDGFRRVLSGMRPGIRDILVGRHQRRALPHVDAIAILMGYQINNYLRPLGLLPKTTRMRLVWEVDAYAGREDPELIAKYAGYDLVYFMIARHTWKSPWSDLKGNDKFLRAFARFVRDRSPNVKLVCIEKGIDVAASKALIADLGIEQHVEWVGEMNKDGLRAYYGLPNAVIVDQFWGDDWTKRFPADLPTPRLGFGSAGLEAMSARKPLITVFFDDDFYDGDRPPILYAFREDEIYQRLLQSVDMGAEGRRALADRAYDFVMKYHDWSTQMDRYIALLEEVLRARRDGRPYRPPEPVS